MKISLRPVGASKSETPGPAATLRPRSSRGAESGFAVLVVLVLLVIMASFAIANNVALVHLQKELKLVERRQQHRHAAINTTNPPAGPALKTAPAQTAGAAPAIVNAP